MKNVDEKICSIDGCNTGGRIVKGMCLRHYYQVLRHGHILPEKEQLYCSVKGCGEKYSSLGYCIKHYHQMKNHGRILPRSKSDPNEFIIHEDHCEIRMFNNYGEYTKSAIIDLQDIELCKQKKWFLSKSYTSEYPATVVEKKTIALHNFLLGELPEGFDEWDHIDRNQMNNRRLNLRPAKRSNNVCNVAPYKNKSSKYKGVGKSKNKWKASIRKNGILHYLGLYKSEKEAAFVYNVFAEKMFGEFAYLNKLW